jgi:thioredoxin-related protein
MNKLSTRTQLILFAIMVVLSTPCLGAQSLPDGWWLQVSPEKALVKAELINQNLNYYQAHKSGSTSSQITNPFAKTHEEARVEFFQTKNADGFVETKKFTLHGKFEFTDYKLKSGRYFFTDGQLIKVEFADGDDFDKPMAAKVDHPYEFKLLKSEIVGTNDCLVIGRLMTDPLLNAVVEIAYKQYAPEKRAEWGSNYIRSEVDYYFRKADGIAFGVTKRNRAGELLENTIYDQVIVNQPIPDREFSLPAGDPKIAKSSEECQEIWGAVRAAKRAKARQNPAAQLSEKRVLELPWTDGLPEAMAKAKAENKIVLLDFTGSDWCVWCIKFDDDVLSKPEFAAYAKTNLVMVMLDFPNAKPQSDLVKKTNKDLQDKFKVDGFPTYVALTPDGKEIGRQIGYLSGGPQAFITKLDKFRNQ